MPNHLTTRKKHIEKKYSFGHFKRRFRKKYISNKNISALRIFLLKSSTKRGWMSAKLRISPHGLRLVSPEPLPVCSSHHHPSHSPSVRHIIRARGWFFDPNPTNSCTIPPHTDNYAVEAQVQVPFSFVSKCWWRKEKS